MRRTVVVLAWALAGLVACERVLALREHAERGSSSRLRRLMPPDRLEGRSVAALRIEDTARRESVLFARTSSGWRCLSRSGVPADETRLNGYLDRLLEAQGLLQRPGPADRQGLSPPHLVRVSLHGARVLQDPHRDLIAFAEIGAALPWGRGTYARPGMSNDVLLVDDDLRADLEWPEAAALAPLVDPRIVPASWPGWAGVERIEVHPPDGAPFELRRRARATTPQEILAGARPWEWFLAVGRGEQATAPHLADAYAGFLQSATYRLALDPRSAEGLGLSQPRARVVLHPAQGPAAGIEIGGPAPLGGVAVRNTLAQSLLAVDQGVASLLAPRADALRRGAKANPWHARPEARGVIAGRGHDGLSSEE